MSTDTTMAFPDLLHAESFGDDDRALVADLHAVLKSHDAIGRFGITLLHSHFPVGSDEILLEETNVAAREQTIRPVARDTLHEDGGFETAWSIDSGTPVPITMCRQNCV
jgi:hypothetical protein